MKPEFQDVVVIASKVGISVKQALDLANSELFHTIGRS
jgi:Flp pilus assembly protein TadB